MEDGGTRCRSTLHEASGSKLEAEPPGDGECRVLILRGYSEYNKRFLNIKGIAGYFAVLANIKKGAVGCATRR
jgi:hypothetical protein